MQPPVKQSKFTFSATVNSESLRDLAYSEEGQVLAVNFQSGKSYVYTNVPKKVAVDLFSADSVGAHFNEHIKGIYNYLKVGLSDQRFTEAVSSETETRQNAELARKEEGSKIGSRNRLLFEYGDKLLSQNNSSFTVSKAIRKMNSSPDFGLSDTEVKHILDELSAKHQGVQTTQVAKRPGRPARTK